MWVIAVDLNKYFNKHAILYLQSKSQASDIFMKSLDRNIFNFELAIYMGESELHFISKFAKLKLK